MKQTITKVVIFLAFIFSCIRSEAQQASGIPFRFTPTSPSVAAVTSVTINLVARPAALRDEFDTLIAPAGWSFNFAGVNYTKFIVSSNGWLALAPASTVALPAYFASALPTNSLSTYAGGLPLIAPLWDDDSCGAIQYGVAANVLTVRWSVKWDKSYVGSFSSLFWVTLDGNTGNIDFHYSNAAYAQSASARASIGIAGVCTGDFYSVTPNATIASTTIDSVTENSNVTLKPVNARYTFIPYSGNDNCSGAFSARSLGTINGTCTYTTSSTFNATPSGAGNCGTTDDNDVWFSFVKPLGSSSVVVTTAPATCLSVTGTSVEVYGACGGAVLGCATTSGTNPGYGEVTLARSACVVETLWVRVTADGDIPGKFLICATSNSGNGTTCATANIICSLPYSQTGMTTTGAGNDYDSTSAVCHTRAMSGEDYIFSYTPPTNQCIQVSITSSGLNPAVFVFSGCPDSTSGVATYCLGNSEVPTGTATLNAITLNAGQTYYIVVDNNGVGGIPFDITVTGTGTPPAYDACASAVNLGTIANTAICGLTTGTYTTSCASPTAVGQAGVPNCIPPSIPSAFVNGVTGDVWLRFTAGFSGSLQINTFQSALNPTSNAAMAVYTGTCGSMGAPYACDNNSGPNGMPSLSIPVVNGTTYYIRVWSETPENAGNFDICFQGNCAPPNDLPCTSVLVPLGGTAAGFNTCASGLSEPANAAQCVAGGTINTVWYKAIVPASGTIRVRTHPLTLTDTQIQGYLFPAGCAAAAGTNTNKGCNDDGVACSGGYNDFSEQLFTGMTPGDTLFIAVDGVGSLTGSFEISIIDGNSTVFPPVYLQDCASPQVICSTSNLVVADPGFRNNGNICDMNPLGCWFTGERNSVWYQFTVDPALSGGTATVAFDILTSASVDIDLIMWDITSVANPCPLIQAGTLPPTRCNYAGANPATGLMNAPLLTGYDNSIVFSGAPRTYLMLLNNWNSSANAGFNLNWNSTPISTAPTNAIWSGLTDTLFATATNWGDCGTTPSCAVDAIINNPANGRQPTVTVASSVKNLTINSGATLRIKTGITLSVCGNFTNLGTLICEPGSTVQFIGAAAQTISGLLNAPNAFANLVINKPSSNVQLLTNIDVTGNFTTSNGMSVFNINGKYMKVGGNFTNNNANTTFTGIGASTVEFNGTINQFFNNQAGSLSLNRVRMNKSTGKLYLVNATSTMNVDSFLVLTSGIIVTPLGAAAQEVNVKHYLPAAITGHNALSFVDGKLRRKISNPTGPSSPIIPASYDFPVGDSLNPGGYQMANITFTTSTLINNLLAYFQPWPSLAPPNPGPTATPECLFATYNVLPMLNNGFWTFERNVTPFGGLYRVTLNSTGYTNQFGASGWSVATDTSLTNNPGLTASWGMRFKCSLLSTLTNTIRDSLNFPSTAINSFNHRYAVAQTTSPLPIELLSFTAEPDGEKVICRWETASETNNDYFEVERSYNAYEFETIGRVPGFGQGISTEKLSYSLTDNESCNDIRYYRLKQVDLDGRLSYSDKIAINCKLNKGIDVFPNPANNQLTCRFVHQGDDKLTLTILDVTGRIVHNQSIDVKKGINQIQLKVEELAAGAYYLKISDRNEIQLQTQFFKN